MLEKIFLWFILSMIVLCFLFPSPTNQLKPISRVVVVSTLMVSINNTQEQFLYFCRNYNWEGTHNLTGDFSGEFNCTELRIKLFDNQGWTKECSTFPFSPKLSCHTLCNMDCEVREIRCIC